MKQEMQIVIVNIEIPKNSNIKYEYDRSTKKMVVDRILRDGFKYPANYGYLSEALDWDGDELDVLVYSEESFIPNVSLKARIVGAMKMIDEGETDTKLIAIHADDYRLENIKKIEDLPQEFLESIKTFFSTYKNWKGKNSTKVTGFEDEKWAWDEYKECVKLMNKYGNLPKKQFIDQMKKEFPNKYE